MAVSPHIVLESQREALRRILQEAAAARSALCENELIIRLDTITDLARKALEHGDGGDGSG